MEWRYHFGCHKTATTHLQMTLDGADLKGTAYIPLDKIRAATDPILKHGKRWRKFRIYRAVKRLAMWSDSVIVSEENLLGYPKDACDFPLYPELEDRLACLPRTDAKAFLAIRHPADFAASIYSEAMRHDPDSVSLEKTRQAFLNEPHPWTGLVDRIRQFFPDLTVWKYEDYRGNEGQFASMVAGQPVIRVMLPDPPETQRLPAQTIAALENARARGETLVKAGELPQPEEPARFEMFTPDERRMLGARYVAETDILSDILVERPFR